MVGIDVLPVPTWSISAKKGMLQNDLSGQQRTVQNVYIDYLVLKLWEIRRKRGRVILLCMVEGKQWSAAYLLQMFAKIFNFNGIRTTKMHFMVSGAHDIDIWNLYTSFCDFTGSVQRTN